MFWRRVRPHNDEFKKTWFGAKSNNGFVVELRRRNWIDYADGKSKCAVFCEFMGLEKGLIVHQRDVEGMKGVPPHDAERIFSNIKRALEFLEWKIDWVSV